jgi:hypothetical protein
MNVNNKEFRVVIIIIILTSINHFIHLASQNVPYQGIQDYIPYTWLMIPTIMISTMINHEVRRALLTFILFEAIIVIFQHYSGIVSFWASTADIYSEHYGTDLMYHQRPCGLSKKPSTVAVKFLIGFIILNQVNIKRREKLLISIVLIYATVLNFNRSVMLAVALYYLYSFATSFDKRFFMKFIISRKIVIGLVLLFAIIGGSLSRIDAIKYQLFRGQLNISESTGRIMIWENGINYIRNNPILGNGSYKYYFKYYDKVFHMHNSYIQIITTHGIIISILFFILIFLVWKRKGKYSILIIIYSFFQYGIFWGISFIDIFFYSNIKTEINSNTKRIGRPL